jgi:pimeloyl-ACP methyl ester carboxylesterase
MPFANCDGIETHYDVLGVGPPLLMFSPGGFNATIENWSTFGIYKRLDLLDHLTERFTCIVFDKRESGQSGGLVELIEWHDYALQGLALLSELGIERAHVMGGCIGCSIALSFAQCYPEATDKLVLYSPAGGPRYRLTQEARFRDHLVFLDDAGLAGLVELVRSTQETFAQDPRLGPWVSVIRRDDEFADDLASMSVENYRRAVEQTAQALFDRDTVPGHSPRALMELPNPVLIAPGNDASHALSAAHYLRECLPNAELWEALPEQQTAETAPAKILAFLEQ